jgi:hypothetical protein
MFLNIFIPMYLNFYFFIVINPRQCPRFWKILLLWFLDLRIWGVVSPTSNIILRWLIFHTITRTYRTYFLIMRFLFIEVIMCNCKVFPGFVWHIRIFITALYLILTNTSLLIERGLLLNIWTLFLSEIKKFSSIHCTSLTKRLLFLLL